jgi:hypothetical protein
MVEGGVIGIDRELLQELLCAVLEKGVPLRFEARGHSMHPFICDRDMVTVAPLPARPLGVGEIVAYRHPASGALLSHRIRDIRPDGLLVQGDSLPKPDAVVGGSDLIGLVTRAERAGRQVHRGEVPPDLRVRLAWRSRVWLRRLARPLVALARQRF